MSAETGVGPAMASGSQVCNGNWPLLPMIPMSRHAALTTRSVCPMPPLSALALITAMLNVPAAKNRTMTPIMRPTSPVRVVRNALTAASEFGFSSHQWPMSTNEHTPTSSQATSSKRVLSATTRSSIDAVKRLRSAK